MTAVKAGVPALHKTVIAKASSNNPLEYIMSDGSVDRVGDIIDPDGWQISDFMSNPIALFNHDTRFVVGKWADVRVENGKLRGRLELMRKGISERLDEVISAVEAGILRAVSVGFRALKSEPMDNGGFRFTKSELMECSLVSIPANPNALQVAKALDLSAETQALIFGETADDDLVPPAPRLIPAGKSAVPSRHQRNHPMTPSQRIDATQQKLVALQDELKDHLDTGDDADESFTTTTDEINGKIASAEKALASLKEAEKHLATTATEVDIVPRETSAPSTVTRDPRKPFAVPAAKVNPIDYFFRALTVQVKNHWTKDPMVVTLKDTYGEDVVTKAVLDMTTRAATVPADTVTPAWAGVLAQTAIGEFFDLLLPSSVFPGLAGYGERYSLGRNGVLRLPYREATPTVAGSFVGQGAPIPVRQAAFNAIELGLKKLAVITTVTRELMEHSTPAIQQILQNAIQEDTAIAIDTVLLDSNAATGVRPAGIRNGATTAAGTAGGGFNAVVADLRGMTSSLITNTAGNLRRPVWIMNQAQILSLSLTQNAGGDFPFEAEVNQNRFRGYPIIVSSTVPAGTVILLDAADFFTTAGEAPMFNVSDQATLHMEDTAPLQIGTAGTPASVAAPVRSMYQTDSIAIRMIMEMNWAFRRTGMVVVRTGVTW